MVAGSSGCRSVGSFCGPIPTVTSSDEQSTSSPHQNQPGRGGVQAFMNGIIGPFMACWQPPITACVSPTGPYGGGCMGPAPSDRSPQATSNIQKPHPNDVLVRLLVESINVMFCCLCLCLLTVLRCIIHYLFCSSLTTVWTRWRNERSHWQSQLSIFGCCQQGSLRDINQEAKDAHGASHCQYCPQTRAARQISSKGWCVRNVV
jgi:hypothetical protein